jgi:hypothetical protein
MDSLIMARGSVAHASFGCSAPLSRAPRWPGRRLAVAAYRLRESYADITSSLEVRCLHHHLMLQNDLVAAADASQQLDQLSYSCAPSLDQGHTEALCFLVVHSVGDLSALATLGAARLMAMLSKQLTVEAN